MIAPMSTLDPAKKDKTAQATASERYKYLAEQMAQMVVDLKQQMAELRQSEVLFRTTFEQAAVGLAHVAPDGRWLRVNQRLCEILGYTTEELLHTSFQAIHTLPTFKWIYKVLLKY